MTTATMRAIGVACLIAAALVSALDLNRAAALGAFWLAFPLLIIGLAFILRARNRRL